MLRMNGGAAEMTWAGGQSRFEVPSAQTLLNLLKATIATLRLWSCRRKTRRQLAKLDDHLLRDIGLTRAEARRESSLPFWRS